MPTASRRPVALVTGANHGIGAATARALAADGAAVLLTYLRMPAEPAPGIPDEYVRARAADGDDIAAEIRALGSNAIAVEADLGNSATIDRLFDAAEADLGPVDILVNNASAWVADSFAGIESDRFGRGVRRVSSETFDRQFAVDARAGALLIAEFARRHVERGGDWGRIVSLTSGGRNGFPEEVSYGAAKAALESYTMSAALELGERGVAANVVHPPVTDTGWVTPEVEDEVRRSPDLLHIAHPEDVAAVIVFLASDAARYVTGNIIRMR